MINESINFWLDVIRVDLYIPFGIFSILLILASFFIKKESFLYQIDEYACKLISFSGILFFILFTLVVCIVYAKGGEEAQALSSRMFGYYWFGFWLQPLLYIILPQLLWFSIIRKSKIIRLILSFFFTISIEKYVILLVSLHRDYLPSSWSMNIFLRESISVILIKLILFFLFVGLYYLIYKQFKKVK